jgi:two-component system OmpR family response regulator
VDDASPISILIVDDDPSFRHLQGLLLQHCGHKTLLASDAENAAKLADGADVALVDMVMPQPDGLKTIPFLRNHNPGLRFIACSGSEEEYFRKELDQLGVEHFLHKPFTVEALIEKLERLRIPRKL